MSNLLKYNRFVVKNDDKLVIDSNQMIQNILDAKKTQSETNYAKQSEQPDEDGFVCGLDAATVEQLVSDDVDLEQLNSDRELISTATQQAEEILREANEKAEEILRKAHDEGYQMGIKDADAYVEELSQKKLQEAERLIEQRKTELEEEYDLKFSQIESELAETLIDVFSRVTLAIAEDKKDVILGLTERALKAIDGKNNFLIKVSDEDYNFVSNNKDRLISVISPDSTLEVIRDDTFVKNQCMIETEFGVINCGLDIQLENLAAEIKLLNCLGGINR